MTKKLMMMVVTAALGVATVAFADPVVTDITAKQRYPWNGLVDIGCKVSGIEGTANGYTFVVVAVNKDTGKEYAATHCTVEKGGTGVSGWEVSENGDYELLWDARTDMGQVVVERMTVRITLEAAGVATGMVQLWEGGPCWADRNIGADAPWDYGLYFWWGDTTGHRPSADGTFAFDFDNDHDILATTELQNAGWVTSDGVLVPAYDAAHVKWGGTWRMPTYQDLEDLTSKCDWIRATTKGVNGYVIHGRGDYAANSIFLPCAGFASGARIARDYVGWYGEYWSSVPDSDLYYHAFDLFFRTDYVRYGASSDHRNRGKTVRPVQGFTGDKKETDPLAVGDSAEFRLDTMDGPRTARAVETIAYSTEWNGGHPVSVSVDGVVIKEALLLEEGDIVWNAAQSGPGTHTLTHTCGGETLTAVFEVASDVVVHFNPNGGVFKNRKTGEKVDKFDQYFVYGAPQKLFTDDLVPLKPDGEFLGWVRETPNVTTGNPIVDGRAEKTWYDDVTEVTYYAVWSSAVKVVFCNYGDELVPSSLADHLKWVVVNEGDTWLRSGDSVQLPPGRHVLFLDYDAAYGWIVGKVRKINDIPYEPPYYSDPERRRLTLDIGNDYSDPFNASGRTIYVSVGPNGDAGPTGEGQVRFTYSYGIRESLRNFIKAGDVPFVPSKVKISVERTEVNESGFIVIPRTQMTGNLTSIELDKFCWLPAGIYHLKEVTYAADTSSGDPYWGAVLNPTFENRLFEVRDGGKTERTIKFDMFGGYDAIRVVFDPREGTCSKKEMWFIWADNANAKIEARIDKTLPTPKKDGFDFDGWYTSASGGREVKKGDAFASFSHYYVTSWTGDYVNYVFYAHWKPTNPSLFPELDMMLSTASVSFKAVPADDVSEYNGYIADANGIVVGTMQVKLGKPNAKTGQASATATVQIGTSKKTFKATDNGKVEIAKDGLTRIEFVGAENFTVFVGDEVASGNYGEYDIYGARNFFSSKDKGEQGAANAILEKWIGPVNIVWSGGNASVSIGKKGKAKVAVTLADGTKATANAQLLVGEEWLCVPVVVTKKMNLAFTLWLPRNGGAALVDGLSGDVVVGKPGALAANAAFRVGKSAALWQQIPGTVLVDYLPDGMAVTQSGAKWTLPKAGKVQKAKDGTIDSSKLGDNPSALKLTYKAKDGSFKGSFKVYADNGGKLKATTVNVSGIVVNGVGYGTATIKKVGSVPIRVE